MKLDADTRAYLRAAAQEAHDDTGSFVSVPCGTLRALLDVAEACAAAVLAAQVRERAQARYVGADIGAPDAEVLESAAAAAGEKEVAVRYVALAALQAAEWLS